FPVLSVTITGLLMIYVINPPASWLNNTLLNGLESLSGFIIGIPVFFEVGIVILLPLVISIHKTTKTNILLIAIPLLAGLSIVHGIVPPHPGAMTAIGIYEANLGKVLL
ncbi:hypothetical protein Q0M30_14635, partial [Staphylococcus aureus]|nr:hypothetical protein [Staphylococcus aureus]